MTFFITLMFVISLAAAWLDCALERDSFGDFRRLMDRIFLDIASREERVTTAAHSLYLEFFNRVYGTNMWSIKRIFASFVSTTIAFSLVVISLGFSETIVGDIWEATLQIEWGTPVGLDAKKMSMPDIFGFLLIVGAILFAVNVVPDFFSLAETRMVLRWAQGRGPLVVLLLLVVDIILTTSIFSVIVAALLNVIVGFVPEKGYLMADLRQYGSQRILLPFLLTTYVTSALWFMFVGTFLLVKLIGRWSPLFLRALEALAQSKRRVLVLSSLANVCIFFVVLFLILIAKVIAVVPMPQTGISKQTAVPIEIGQTYKGDFRARSEYWVSFFSVEGVGYAVEARPYGIIADTELTVFDSNGCWYDDDSGSRMYGSVIRLMPEGDRVDVRVSSFGERSLASDFTMRVSRIDGREVDDRDKESCG